MYASNRKTDISPANQSLITELLEWFDTWPRDRGALIDDEVRMTGALHPYDHLFSPISVNQLSLKNRLVMGPMGNMAMVDAAGCPSSKMIAYFEARARGGTGLLISGLVPVSPESDPAVDQPGSFAWFPRMDGTRGVMAGWRDLAECIHALGARFFIQLTAGLGRVGSPECLPTRWRLPVSASWNRNFYLPQIPCRPLTNRACRRIVRDFGQAARDAKACGIDGIHIHGHEGYLLEQFSNPAFNRRRFGRYADWQAFGMDVVREIRRRCGPDYPIMYRIDLSLALQETYGALMDTDPGLRRFRGERTVTQSLDYIAKLIMAGVDVLDVDLGCYENWWLPHPPGSMPPGAFLRVAKCVKDYLAANEITSNLGYPVPVVAVGKLGYPDLAERALRDANCDMVMLARPLLADPDWPRKACAGRVRDITPCIGDHEGCLSEIFRGGHVQCTVNPCAGFEERIPTQLPPVARPRRIAVVGAGPAGITVACLAAERGHEIVLFEREAQIGGWLRAGSAPAIKFDVANYLVHLEHRLDASARHHGIYCRLATEATPDLLFSGAFEAVVCCTGSTPKLPSIAQAADARTALATDVLLAPSTTAGARDIVIIGGGDVGCETAHMLAFEYGKRVTVVDIAPNLMPASCMANRGHLIHVLQQHGVRLLTGVRLERIGEGAVHLLRNIAPTLAPGAVWRPLLPENVHNPFACELNSQEERITLATDLVIFAVGLTSNDALYRACASAHVFREIHNIGDAFSVGRIFDATKAAYATALTL